LTEAGGVIRKVRVLFLAASPCSMTRLSLDEEMREITEKVRMSEGRDRLDLISRWAVRPGDLLQHLNEVQPDIVHFSGHGSPDNEIILQGNNGEPSPVSAGALASLFRTLKDNVRVVILNACYSSDQADVIRSSIDCVIGMNDTIDDGAAIVFAGSFYRAIGFNRTIQEAYDQAITALLLDNLDEDAKVPELLAAEQAVNQRLLA
jgi:hypothetical protein